MGWGTWLVWIPLLGNPLSSSKANRSKLRGNFLCKHHLVKRHLGITNKYFPPSLLNAPSWMYNVCHLFSLYDQFCKIYPFDMFCCWFDQKVRPIHLHNPTALTRSGGQLWLTAVSSFDLSGLGEDRFCLIWLTGILSV